MQKDDISVNPDRETPTTLGWVKVEAIEPDNEFDRFGFLVDNTNRTSGRQEQTRSHNYYNDGLVESTTAQNTWNKLLANWHNLSDSKRDEHIKSGVPANLRGRVWATVLDIAAAKKKASFDYDESLKISIEIRDGRFMAEKDEDDYRVKWASNYGTPAAKKMRKPKDALADDGRYPSAKALKQIDLDLDRTFYDHKNLMEKGGEGQQILWNILAVYARVNPKVGYCQGMAYIAAVLLMNMDEEDAFWAFYVLMKSKDHFDGYFSENLARVQHEAAIFEEVIGIALPDLSEHVKNMGIHPLMYVTPWFMCAFTALPLWDTVMCIWDMMMLQGTKTLTRAALAVMTVCKTDLIATDSLGTLLPYLQHLPAEKTRRPQFPKAMWRIKTATLDSMIDKAEKLVADAKAKQSAPKPRHSVKRGRSEENLSTPTQKRSRAETAADPAPTPSVFRRFMNSLATPLRTRARLDGAETPAPRRKGSSLALATSTDPASVRTPLIEVKTAAAANTVEDSPLPTPTTKASVSTRLMSALGEVSPFASPIFGPNSPFNRSGFLSPNFSGKVPEVLSPFLTAVSNMSPIFAKESFATFTQATPHRASAATDVSSTGKTLEMTTFRSHIQSSKHIPRQGTPLQGTPLQNTSRQATPRHGTPLRASE